MFARSLLSAALLVTSVCAVSYRGVDISSLPVLEASGQTYSDDGSTQPLEKILANHGANVARIRVWASDSSEYNLAQAIELAQRSSDAGMDVMVDFHFSDTCEFWMWL